MGRRMNISKLAAENYIHQNFPIQNETEFSVLWTFISSKVNRKNLSEVLYVVIQRTIF